MSGNRINYLFLDSRNRLSSSTPSKAIFQFRDPIDLSRGTELYITQLMLPMTHYTVRQGVNDVIPSDLGNTTLTPGIYTITSLLSHIETAMSTATSTTITCSVSNYLVTIASTGTPTIPWTNSSHSAAYLLGFDPATDLTAAASHTGTNPYDLSRPHYLHISFPDFGNDTLHIPDDSDRSAHFSIPITAASGDVMEYSPVGVFVMPLQVLIPVMVGRLTVQLKDEEGNDFVRSDWCMTLRVRNAS